MQIMLRAEAKSLGFKRYYTGKPCKHGHVALREVANGTCVTCSYEHPSRKTEQARARNKISQDKYNKKFPEAKSKSQEKYYYSNLEFIREKNRAYSARFRNSNRDLANERNKAWKKKNKEKVAAYSAEYLKKYRDTEVGRASKRVSGAKRRAINKLATPSWNDMNKVKKIYRELPDGMAVDHIIPLVSEFVCGLHVEYNLQYLTKSENSIKGNRWWPDMWE